MGDVREALEADRDQLWAEAVERYRHGEALYLSEDLEKEARKRQEDFNDDADDPMIALLHDFLLMKLPPDWNTYDLNRRRAYLKDPDPLNADATEERTRVCAAEFLCERMGINFNDKDYRYQVRKVKKMLCDFGWEEKA